MNHGTREFSFSSHVAVNQRPASHLEISETALTQKANLYTELIAGENGPPETTSVDAGKINQLILAAGVFIKKKRGAGLRQRFHEERARHDRVTGEMALKKRLAVRNIFYSDNKGFAVGFQNTVNQQKRMPVRQNFLNIRNIFHTLCFQSKYY